MSDFKHPTYFRNIFRYHKNEVSYSWKIFGNIMDIELYRENKDRYTFLYIMLGNNISHYTCFDLVRSYFENQRFIFGVYLANESVIFIAVGTSFQNSCNYHYYKI